MDIMKVIELEEATLEAAIWWCSEKDIYPEVNLLVDGMGYYYHVRGMWDKKLILHPMAADIARRHHDRLEEINALDKLIQVLSRQSNWKEANRFRPRLHELVSSGPLPDENLIEYLCTESFYWLAQDNINQIENLWLKHQNLAHSSNGHMVRSWLADCLLAKHRWDEAVSLLRISLNEVTSNHIQRGIIAIRIKLIAVALEQGKLDESARELEEISPLAFENLDRQYMAFIQSYYGYLYSRQNNIPSARIAYTKALDLFERLGMRREAKKVRTALNGIDDEHPDRVELPQLP
jgi:predicted negative regulator of RcsB-dependent stress response